MPSPPSPMRDAGLVRSIIATSPGQTLSELSLSTGLWIQELAPITRALYDQRLIEQRDGRLFVRERRRKPEPSLRSFWSRLFRRGN
jgi:hypothetical protein